jgi:type II secretory ATPase GspE/PulE/Tfp pilus assembly ATPase PilB-like protein
MIASDLVRALAVLALEYEVVSASKAVEIIEKSEGNSNRLVELLIEESSDVAVLRAVAKELSTRFIDLYSPKMPYRIDERLLRQFDIEVLHRYGALPMYDEQDNVVVAISNPSDLDLRSYVSSKVPEVVFGLSPKDQILSRLALVRSGFAQEIEEDEEVVEAEKKIVVAPTRRSPLLAWFESLLESAVAQSASDIHLELQADGQMLLRLRVDGILRQMPTALRGKEMEVLGLVMNKAELDAANYFDPQDGQFSFVTQGRAVDVRVAMIPQVNGPMIVLRLLDSNNVRRRLADMGFSEMQLEQLRAAALSPQGMVVVSGPTGSGKTTTLYALLREATSVERKVVSIEDPVEYRLPLVSQIQVRTASARPLTFARALRSVLRMDPDVVLVGEVRDEETARTALDAAITGHLVFTTVHSKDSVSTYSRLIEIGAAPYLAADAISLSVAQRLVRRAHDCAVLAPPDPRDLARYRSLGVEVPDRILHARGCDGCGGSGYRGRVAVVEVLRPNAALREMVRHHTSADEMYRQARADGLQTLADNAARLVAENITTSEEVFRMLERGG